MTVNSEAATYALIVFIFSVAASQLGPWLALRYFTRFKSEVHAPKIENVASIFPGNVLPDGTTEEDALQKALELEASRSQNYPLHQAINSARSQYAAVLSIAALCFSEAMLLAIFKSLSTSTLLVLVAVAILLLIVAIWPNFKDVDPLEIKAHIEKQLDPKRAKSVIPPLNTMLGVTRCILLVAHFIFLYLLASFSTTTNLEPVDGKTGSKSSVTQQDKNQHN